MDCDGHGYDSHAIDFGARRGCKDDFGRRDHNWWRLVQHGCGRQWKPLTISLVLTVTGGLSINANGDVSDARGGAGGMLALLGTNTISGDIIPFE